MHSNDMRILAKNGVGSEHDVKGCIRSTKTENNLLHPE